MTLRVLLSPPAKERLELRLNTLAKEHGGIPLSVVHPEQSASLPADIAFISRDVTGLSTKHVITPETKVYYDCMLANAALKWVHIHSAGADRAVYQALMARGVKVTTSSGGNAVVVAQSALAGILALARCHPKLAAAQREQRWAPLLGQQTPKELAGQTALIVGMGPIGQQLKCYLEMLGLKVLTVRRTSAPGALHESLPKANWLVLACALNASTTGLIGAPELALLPSGAQVVNVSRGEVMVEPDLIQALRHEHIAGAFLDVFAYEPLALDSPLWTMPNVMVSPHSAGFSDGNAARVEQFFVDNFRLWLLGEPLRNLAQIA
jgi:D-2-hydroxyacid dehydrogenase (NADP+)